MKSVRALASVVSALTLACTAHPSLPASPPASAAAPRVANLHAFARLYGVVRWFYPGDAAAAVDWNRFAIDGAHRVVGARDGTELRDGLRELFGAVAPAVQIAGSGEKLVDAPGLRPADTTGLELVSWEHLGYGDTAYKSIYNSKRRHRAVTVPAPGAPFAALHQSIDATPYRGLPIRLRGKIRVSEGSHASFWLRVDRPGGTVGYFDNMLDRPIKATSWTDAEIVGTVDSDAEHIVFGPLIDVAGTAWFDAVDLEVQQGGAWKPIAIADAGFEADAPLTVWGFGPGKREIGPDGWDVAADPASPAEGRTSLRLARKVVQQTEELFDEAPRAGESVDLDLGQGVRARVPIALYSRDGHTLDAATAPAATAPVAPVAPDTSSGAASEFDPLTGAADVIVVWNALEHFWPYWDLVQVDWNQELDRALDDALHDRSVDEHLTTLRRLSAAAPDGHAHVTCPGASKRLSLPFVLAEAEGHLVVTASADPAVLRGDELLFVDGVDAMTELAKEAALVSGSPQWRRVVALLRLGQGPSGSVAALRVRRDDKVLDLRVARIDEDPVDPPAHAPIEELPHGIWYVDMARASMPDLDAAMSKLAAARGVVVDMRGYPNGTHDLLSHVITAPEHARWMHVAHIIRPDHVAPPAWRDDGWDMAPKSPRLANVVFMTGPGAISYAESVMGYVETTSVPIVGAATAGTNGNVAEIAEPTGCSTIFTGMRVDKHDGTRHHLIGVSPTVPVARTVAGIREGRDEVLEAAVARLLANP